MHRNGERTTGTSSTRSLRGGLTIIVAVTAILLTAYSAPASAGVATTPGNSTENSFRDTVRGGGAAAHTLAARQALRGIDNFKRLYPDFKPRATFAQTLAAISELRRTTESGVTPLIGDPGFNCGTQWAFLRAGDDGYLKPDSNFRIFANGNRNQDYWNQEFLFCWGLGWASDHWALLSNRSGKWVQPLNNGASFYANSNEGLWSGGPDIWIENRSVSFVQSWYDSNFATFRPLGVDSWGGGCPLLTAQKNQSGVPITVGCPLGGWQLFRVEI